ncbi:hypothetical protein XarbCFBP8132_12805 [Xanthomonas arboricola]|nr:hypothetical protein XarbCFBP8132_12805 [Xanthomonas arboricola]
MGGALKLSSLLKPLFVGAIRHCLRATGARAASAGTALVNCRLRWAAAARPAIGCSARSDILSDSPPRHIPVPLSANPRPRCCLGHSLSWPWKH